MIQLVMATWNRDKVKEIQKYLRGLDLDIEGAGDQEGLEAPEETGDSLEENALIKVRAVAEASLKLSLADDTGLEVDALGGRPGVRAARFAGPNPTYADNMNYLLEKMKDVPKGRRKARFRTVLALGLWEGRYHTVEGVLEGEITTEPLGHNGFGYDPVFFVPASGKTLAEMNIEEKNMISHRGKALAKARAMLEGWLKTNGKVQNEKLKEK